MNRTRISDWIRRRGPAFALDCAVNIAAPLAIYHQTQGPWGELHALLVSSIPPLLWGIGSFLRSRRVDALSVLAVAGIALSTLAYFGGGSAQMLQLREKLVTLVIALAFLGSAAIGKPLIYPLARATMARQSEQALAEFDAKGNDAPVRHTVMVMTLVWGIGLLADFAVSVALIYLLTIEQYLVVGPIIGYVAVGGMMLWTILYRRYRTQHADAVRVATVASTTKDGDDCHQKALT
ncbi:VC0807 family protein (plasmid) [Novosphingobium sp. BL-8A]|uniref:VC0807 family protein n=1 Tax=Novosphingobium sp. BL-8A TaxID=3127639 RepID=UPI00375781AA